MTLMQWFNERSENERNLLLGAAAVLLVLFISMALGPMYKSLQQNERRVARQFVELDQMKTIAGQSSMNPAPGVTAPGGSLVILLQSSARRCHRNDAAYRRGLDQYAARRCIFQRDDKLACGARIAGHQRANGLLASRPGKRHGRFQPAAQKKLTAASSSRT